MDQTTQNISAKVVRFKKPYLLITIGILASILLTGATWFTLSTLNTLSRIGGRSWTSISYSMEPADIDLITYRSLDKEVRPKDNPVRWHMRLPRAYIVSMSEPAGVPYDTSNGEKNARPTFVGINLQFDQEKQGWVPSVLKKASGEGFVSLHVTNTGGFIALGQRTGRCIPQDQFRELQLAVGLGATANTTCDIRNNRCQIVTDLDRWQIKMTVSADLYTDHENTCRMVNDFLNKHTLMRTKR